MPVRRAGLQVSLQRRIIGAFVRRGTEEVERIPGEVEDPATDTEIGVDLAVRGLRRSGWIGLDGLAVNQLFRAGAPLPEVGGTSFWAPGDGYVMQLRQRYQGAYEMRRALVGDDYGVDAKAATFLDGAEPAIVRRLGLGW